jgi:restriction endonuclease
MEKIKNREQYLGDFKEIWKSLKINSIFETGLKKHNFFQQDMTNIEVSFEIK